MQWLPVQSPKTASSTHPRSAPSASMAVAAGRSSDFGLPTPLPLPILACEAVRWLLAEQCFVPITAAGQHWIHTSFPFNKPQSGLDLHGPILHVRGVPWELARFAGISVCGPVPWSLVIESENHPETGKSRQNLTPIAVRSLAEKAHEEDKSDVRKGQDEFRRYTLNQKVKRYL